jgi:hypothetical protein
MNSTVPVTPDRPIVATDEFSLVLGGPLFHLWRRTRLSGENLELLRRRIIAMVLVTWMPLFLLASFEGHAWRGTARLPFLLDAEQHLRLLLALPLLIFGELLVHRRICLIVRQFLSRGLISESARARFDAAVTSARRLRNASAAELVLIAFVYGFGVPYFWRNYGALDVVSWYGIIVAGRFHPSLAGWWLGCVSLPLLQFLLLRWYFRLFIWMRFLWQVSKIELRLVPSHPDECGGIGFLNLVQGAFAPLVLAQGILLSGLIANRVFFAGARLPDFLVDIVVILAVTVSVIFVPLLVFAPQLNEAAATGMLEYGALAQQYVREFEQKWLRSTESIGEPLLGSADIQSLADWSNGFEVVQEMRSVPFTIRDVLQLGAIALLPILPLMLTMLSLRELLERIIRLLF